MAAFGYARNEIRWWPQLERRGCAQMSGVALVCIDHRPPELPQVGPLAPSLRAAPVCVHHRGAELR
jgi:hypothetical protein